MLFTLKREFRNQYFVVILLMPLLHCVSVLIRSLLLLVSTDVFLIEMNLCGKIF